MSRLQADLALLFAGLIWGFGFVAQKDALNDIGPFTFVAFRFLLSALIILPLVLREKSPKRVREDFSKNRNIKKLIALCTAFTGGVLIQQYGLTKATVINTAFLTGLYVVLTPVAGFILFRHKLSPLILAAGLFSILGIWLLSGFSFSNLAAFSGGDGLALLCALVFAIQVAIMGEISNLMRAPFLLSWLQYAAVAIVALALALCFEKIEWHGLIAAWWPILFAGIASGGIAYTLQAVAQQHTPPADAAIIMSSEALFGGLGGVLVLHETIATRGIVGCCAVMAAIALVELGPLWRRGRPKRQSSKP